MSKLVLVLLAASLPVFCADEALPSAEAVLNHWLEASGGRAAWEARHNTIQNGAIDFTGRGLKGTITIYQAAPDKNLEVIELPGVGKIESGSDGNVAWENSALQGPRIKQGVERTNALRDGAFNASLNWQKLYAKAETAGSETIEGHDCYKVVLTPSEGQPVTEFYDKQSALLIETAATRTTPMGDISGVVVYDDYRKEGDVLAPHKMINRFAQQEFQITIQSIQFNVNMPADRFDLPLEVKGLLTKTVSPGTLPKASQ
jgi:hypothetical protein